jgi:hypothetical protein
MLGAVVGAGAVGAIVGAGAVGVGAGFVVATTLSYDGAASGRGSSTPSSIRLPHAASRPNKQNKPVFFILSQTPSNSRAAGLTVRMVTLRNTGNQRSFEA